jgi:hypothetical protein
MDSYPIPPAHLTRPPANPRMLRMTESAESRLG